MIEIDFLLGKKDSPVAINDEFVGKKKEREQTLIFSLTFGGFLK